MTLQMITNKNVSLQVYQEEALSYVTAEIFISKTQWAQDPCLNRGKISLNWKCYACINETSPTQHKLRTEKNPLYIFKERKWLLNANKSTLFIILLISVIFIWTNQCWKVNMCSSSSAFLEFCDI